MTNTMKHNFLKSLRLCAFVALVLCSVGMAWGQSDYSTDYTGNITLSTSEGTEATACTINISNNGYSGIKVGTSKNAGAVKITVPSGTKYLHLHVAAWNGESGTLSISPTNYYNTTSSISLSANSGIAGSGTTYNLTGSEFNNYYKVITFTRSLTQDIQFTFSYSKRFVIWGVTAEEDLPPSDLALSGAPVDLTFATPSSDAQIISYTTSSTGAITVSESNYVTTTINSSNKTITVIPTTATPSAQTITVSQAKDNNYAAGRVTFTVIVNKPRHTATFYINGQTSNQDFEEGAPITFPENPSNIYGKTFMGWTTTAINGVQNNAPTMVSSETMGNTNITYYAVFAEENISEQEITKTYGFENTENDASYWDINGPSKDNTQHKTGNYSGKIKTNNTYVTFINKVNVTEFSFEFKRTSNNNNYNVYIETSTDNNSWTAVETYAMSSFTQDTWHKKSRAFDGNSELYVRFHCNNTTATRFVDDVTIKYRENVTTYSSYCTTVPTTATFTISAACYDVVDNANIYYGTYSNASAFVVPEGLTVHTVSVANGVLAVADYTSGAIVPANTGVMVSSTTAGEKTVNLTTATATVDTEDNMLHPTGSGITYRQMAAADANCKFYYLTMNGSQIGFYRRNDTGAAFDMLVANKAYLAVPEDEVGEIKGFSFNDVVDGIQAVETEKAKNDVIYNLAGQRVSKMQKGLYIVNGKKVLVK